MGSLDGGKLAEFVAYFAGAAMAIGAGLAAAFGAARKWGSGVGVDAVDRVDGGRGVERRGSHEPRRAEDRGRVEHLEGQMRDALKRLGRVESKLDHVERDVKKDLAVVFERVNETAENVAYIRGYIDNRKQGG
jgi:hypothetical protein